jgi:hypothetical protein
MNIPWNGDRCIICLLPKPFTREHIIPESLGGKLTSHFLCKDCNSRLGAEVDRTAKTDPAIRRAAMALSAVNPDLLRAINDSQIFNTNQDIQFKAKGDTLKVRPKRNADGSLIQANEDARKTLARIMEKAGKSKVFVESRLEAYDKAPSGVLIQLMPDLAVKKWKPSEIKLFPGGDPMHSTLLLKIAYELIALHLGDTIYDDDPPLVMLRAALTDFREPYPFVELYTARQQRRDLFHGLVFEGNSPIARVQIRLFGTLAYRVNFPMLAVGGPRYGYHLDLATGDESLMDLETRLSYEFPA